MKKFDRINDAFYTKVSNEDQHDRLVEFAEDLGLMVPSLFSKYSPGFKYFRVGDGGWPARFHDIGSNNSRYPNLPFKPYEEAVKFLESFTEPQLPENTVVSVKAQEEYDTLMEAYERIGWKWCSGKQPTGFDGWSDYKDETCVRLEDKFGYQEQEYYEGQGWTIITLEEALEILREVYPEKMKGFRQYQYKPMKVDIPQSKANKMLTQLAKKDFADAWTYAWQYSWLPKLINPSQPNPNNMDRLQTLTNALKRHLSKKARTQYKAGFINGGLEITQRGKDAMWDVLIEKFEEEWTKKAEERIKDLEDSE